MMKRSTPITALVAAAVLCAGCSDDDTINDPMPAGDATYTVTFTASWSAATHPDGFPPNPHFSRLVGGTHNAAVTFWEPGGMATTGIKNMAELGATTALETEVNTAVNDGSAEHVLVGGNINPSPGETSLTFTVSSDYPLITLVSMIAPSPDWFVGVSGLNLLDGNDWAATVTADLYLYDAGTDDGTDYTSANAPSDPHVPIRQITGYPARVGDDIPSIGTFTFTRQESSEQ